MIGLFSAVLFASLCDSPFFANIMLAVLVVWLCLFFGTLGKR
jgi:hypothetical protein